MRKVLVIGSGISGLTTAIECAKNGDSVILVSPFISERAQSVMAAGGINSVLQNSEDTIQKHIEDTLKGGANIAGEETVSGLCNDAVEILKWLDSIGVMFNRESDGTISRRAFGGQSYNRTAYAGASTGKQIVTALIRETRKYECSGKIERIVGLNFYSALIKNKRCYGALFHNKVTNALEPIYADSVVIATGGQNQLFGKTTGTALCDGYVAGELFLQGAVLKNLEFIQYHPTTIETSLKRMLISEAARGEGGRLYYLDGDKRVYFMEERFGENGNLMPRDVVSRCMFELGKPVFLDVSFLGEETILSKIGEVYDLCKSYLNIDITKESIPVAPSVHFFMGGLAVDKNHRTSIENIYAVGECASIYHGANRLGGNSLLAAVHSGRVAAADIKANNNENEIESFGDYIEQENKTLNAMCQVENGKSPIAIFNNLATIMKSNLGIVRSGDDLKSTISVIDEIIESSNEVDLSKSLSTYQAYSVRAILTLARAMATCANERKETRGAHIRKDYPDTKEEYEKCSLIKYDNGEYIVRYEKEDEICW